MAADALMILLNQRGYQPIYVPLTNLQPPELYTFVRQPSRRLVRHGPLIYYLPTDLRGIARRDVFAETTGKVADIEGKQTTGKHLEAAVNFLASALRCIGIEGAPKLDLSFTGDKELSFSFTGITYRRVDPAQIEQVVQELETVAIDDNYVREGRVHIV
jgi:hypothetical protein